MPSQELSDRLNRVNLTYLENGSKRKILLEELDASKTYRLSVRKKGGVSIIHRGRSVDQIMKILNDEYTEDDLRNSTVYIIDRRD